MHDPRKFPRDADEDEHIEKEQDHVDVIPSGRLKVLVTQPRRIACISLAKRVASTLGEELGNSVGYQISGDTCVKKHTQIIFVTTGYLLQVVVNSPERLNEFSHIVLDEVHERDIDADLVGSVVNDVVGKEVQLIEQEGGFVAQQSLRARAS